MSFLQVTTVLRAEISWCLSASQAGAQLKLLQNTEKGGGVGKGEEEKEEGQETTY